MPDVAIIGGGLCGLALAHSLQARGVDWALFDARDRLGGRILTAIGAGGVPLDLGPTWYWPATQPSMARLVDDLGLATIEQADDGRVLLLDDPNRAPQPVAMTPDGRLDGAAMAVPGTVHGGARRLAGGMAALVRALAAPLPTDRIHLGQSLGGLRRREDHVELLGLHGAWSSGARAGRVVLALPPRVAQHGLAFEPPLPAALRQRLRATPTWMANAAKAALACERPFWRDAGLTGNAWVTHRQAVLAEVFDASPVGGARGGALAGFIALGPEARQTYRVGLPLLIESQFATLFGNAAQDGELHLHDWATEATTCSPLDREELASMPGAADADLDLLTQPLWQGRLLFGGSETARQGAGYLEGALGAAARLRRQLGDLGRTALRPAAPRSAYFD